MNRGRDNTGRPSGRFSATFACAFLTLAVSGAALANPEGGSCGKCGSGDGSDHARHEASQTAGDKAEAGVNQTGPATTGGRGGRPDEILGDAITQLATAIEAAKAEEADRQAALSGPPATRRDPQAEAEAKAKWEAWEKERARLAEIHKQDADISPAWRAELEKHLGWDNPPGPVQIQGGGNPAGTAPNPGTSPPAPGTTPPDPTPATPSAASAPASPPQPAADDDLPGVNKRSPYYQ